MGPREKKPGGLFKPPGKDSHQPVEPGLGLENIAQLECIGLSDTPNGGAFGVGGDDPKTAFTCQEVETESVFSGLAALRVDQTIAFVLPGAVAAEFPERLAKTRSGLVILETRLWVMASARWHPRAGISAPDLDT